LIVTLVTPETDFKPNFCKAFLDFFSALLCLVVPYVRRETYQKKRRIVSLPTLPLLLCVHARVLLHVCVDGYLLLLLLAHTHLVRFLKSLNENVRLQQQNCIYLFHLKIPTLPLLLLYPDERYSLLCLLVPSILKIQTTSTNDVGTCNAKLRGFLQCCLVSKRCIEFVIVTKRFILTDNCGRVLQDGTNTFIFVITVLVYFTRLKARSRQGFVPRQAKDCKSFLAIVV